MSTSQKQITLLYSQRLDLPKSIIKNGKRVREEEPADPKRWKVVETCNTIHYTIGQVLAKSEVQELCKGSNYIVRVIDHSMLHTDHY